MRFAYADELAIGAAGEHLVCADLLRLGYRPCRMESAPYDVGVDVGDRLLRLQIKATCEPKAFLQQRQTHVTGYTWGLRRGRVSSGNQRPYDETEIDGVACVALDTGQIAYVPAPWPQVFQIPTEGAKASKRCFDDYPFGRLLA